MADSVHTLTRKENYSYWKVSVDRRPIDILVFMFFFISSSFILVCIRGIIIIWWINNSVVIERHDSIIFCGLTYLKHHRRSTDFCLLFVFSSFSKHQKPGLKKTLILITQQFCMRILNLSGFYVIVQSFFFIVVFFYL